MEGMLFVGRRLNRGASGRPHHRASQRVRLNSWALLTMFDASEEREVMLTRATRR